LIAWFSRHARDLPWRRSRDPYRVWVSEIMLQQTVVATVVPYFNAFVARFPEVVALADADLQDVLQLWEGLGYYRRARQLHKAAQLLRAEHNGYFPRDIETVRRLPGIGRYTAGAILSIAFDDPHPILEANTIRLLARLLAFRGDTSTAHGRRVLWSAAERLLPSRGAGTFNQALMELGSQICTPRNPHCGTCPLAAFCLAKRMELIDVIPAARARPKIEAVQEAAVVVCRRTRLLLVKRNAGERWAGLWDFPRFPLVVHAGRDVTAQLVEQVARLTGLRIEPREQLTTIKHSVTRFRITLDCYRADYVGRAASQDGDRTMRWVLPEQLTDFPLSKSARTLARLVAAANICSSARLPGA
jgi:A/G-specific adenine glycosylase